MPLDLFTFHAHCIYRCIKGLKADSDSSEREQTALYIELFPNWYKEDPRRLEEQGRMQAELTARLTTINNTSKNSLNAHKIQNCKGTA